MSVAAHALLHLAEDSRGYSSGSYLQDGKINAMMELTKALHQAGQLDLKHPMHSGTHKSVEGATFPVAILGVGNVREDFFRMLHELDPQCLEAQSRGKPAFMDAVQSRVQQEGPSPGRHLLNESIDGLLSFWAQVIPKEQLLFMDHPGDDPGAGLIGHLRSVGAFPQLQEVLTEIGFSPNARRAGAIPTACSIETLDQLKVFLQTGGDLLEEVPVKWPGREDPVELWEYLFQRQDHAHGKTDVVEEIGRWCQTQGSDHTNKFAERDHWFRLKVAASRGKEDLLAWLKESPGWEHRRDFIGRNALHVAGPLCPPFINHVMGTKSLSHMLTEKDNMGHGVVGHVMPALANYNRRVDAEKIASKLLRSHGRFRDVDEINECGLVVGYLLDQARHGMSTLAQPSRLYGATGSKTMMPTPLLWFGTTEQYDLIVDELGKFMHGSSSLGAVKRCVDALFKNACEGKRTDKSSYRYGQKENYEQVQSLELFNNMPRKLQQVIVLASLTLPHIKDTASSSSPPIGPSIDKNDTFQWVKDILQDLQIEVPQAYLEKQAKRFEKWRIKDTSSRTQAVGPFLEFLRVAEASRSLKSSVQNVQPQEKGPDCEQSRPGPRF